MPEEVVHDVGGFEEQAEHLALVVAKVTDVGGEGVLGILVRQVGGLFLNRLLGLFSGLVTVSGGTEGQGCDDC